MSVTPTAPYSTARKAVRSISVADVRGADDVPLSVLLASIGSRRPSNTYLEDELGIPVHVRVAVDGLVQSHEIEVKDADIALSSIPFYSLCRGLLLPLAQMHTSMVAQTFDLAAPTPLDAAAREKLLETFLQKNVGLSLSNKIACILGDPFRGRRSTFKRDSMLRLVLSMRMSRRRELLDRLTALGDVALVFAEARPHGRIDPALTAAEVLEALRFLPDLVRTDKFTVLRSLLSRMGKLEAYFLAKLLLRKAGFGFDYQGPLVARKLAQAYGADEDLVLHAVALTDPFQVTKALETGGVVALRKIQLKPLSPLRPALAMQGRVEIEKFPVWVERKYDGVRLMLHKSTDALRNVLAGAYTRTRSDWLQDVRALESTIRALPCRECIVDGELHGAVSDFDTDGGRRPATVYDILQLVGGAPEKPIRLQFAAFDLLYVDGQDLTHRPLRERRAMLQALVGGLAGAPLAVPIDLADGQLADTQEDVNRRFHHFRNQGYEGIICKDLDGPYRIAMRDPSWVKRKPEVTLDLVLLAGVFAVTTKETAGMFGSYAIGARLPDGSFEDVGDVAGVDVERDRSIQQTIAMEGLVTGRRIERASASGVRPGLELRPHMVVTVKFEGVTKDGVTKKLSLRDPKIATLRPDKNASEASGVADLEALYRKERFS